MNIPRNFRPAGVPLLSLAFLLLVSCADAAVFVVDRNDDDAKAFACTDAPNDCSLRGAIAAAEAVATDDQVSFDPVVFGANNVVTLSSSRYVVRGNGRLVIDGSSSGFVTINAAGFSGVFEIYATADVSVSYVSMTGSNRLIAAGGAVENRGVFSLSYSTVYGNKGGSGGGLYNSGQMSVSNSTVCFNQSAYGGAVHNVGSSAVTNVSDSTLCFNTSTYGGGIYVSSGTVNLSNTIVSNNSATTGGPDVWQTVVSQGFNLVSNSSGMTVAGSGTDDQFNVDPMLDPAGLADNGGKSLTVALLPGSPAIDTGNSAELDDQRNAMRPMDDPDSTDGNGNLADVGAYEFTPVVEPPPPPPPPDPTPTYEFSGFMKPIDGDSLNTVNARGVVSVKFSLNGFQGFDIFEDGYPASQEFVCKTGDLVGEPERVINPGNSGLGYNPETDVYSFGWQTDSNWAGTCRRLMVLLNDGSMHTADFSFK